MNALLIPTSSVRRKMLLGTGAVVAMLALGFFLRPTQPADISKSGIPIPFLTQDSSLKGAVTFFGRRNGIDVYEVTYKNGERSETLLPDRIYLVHIPNLLEILDAPLDVVVTSVVTGGRNVNYYGYRYSDAAASDERKNFAAVLFKDRFPAQFFASQKAKDEDAAHGNQLTAFALQNGITFRKTDGSSGSVRLDPLGSLYVFIVNEPGGANLFARAGGICLNGVLEPGEECDDLNTDDTDSCSNTCRYNIPIPFGSGSIAAGTKLAVSVQTVAPGGNAVLNQTGVTLMRFDTGGPEDTRLNSIIAKATTGSLLNATKYELWVDADHEGHIDTKVATGSVSNGLLTFGTIGGLTGYPIPANAVTTFEVRGSIAAAPFSSKLQLGLASTRTDYVAGRRETPAVPLSGIRLDGFCGQAVCQIAVTNRPSTVWTITNFPVCGNGVIQSGETCDDSNTASGDGCSNLCAVEQGYACTGTPSVCTIISVCGDGAITGSETCDDANTTAGDGCNASCAPESGYACLGQPSVCTLQTAAVTAVRLSMHTGSQIVAGQTGVTLLRFKLTAGPKRIVSGNPVTDTFRIQSLIVRSTTGALSDFSACRIFGDTDRNGTPDQLVSGTTCLALAGTLTVGVQDAITLLSEESKDYFLVADFSATPAGSAYQVHIPDDNVFVTVKADYTGGSSNQDITEHRYDNVCISPVTTNLTLCSTGVWAQTATGSTTLYTVSIPVVCGNGITQGTEQCDDGNQSNTDACTNVCQNAVCGDTFIQGTEECDDGNQIETDDCDNACNLTTPTPQF